MNILSLFQKNLAFLPFVFSPTPRTDSRVGLLPQRQTCFQHLWSPPAIIWGIQSPRRLPSRPGSVVNLSQILPPGAVGLNRHSDCDRSGLEIPQSEKAHSNGQRDSITTRRTLSFDMLALSEILLHSFLSSLEDRKKFDVLLLPTSRTATRD
jgi:hypothetical protein